MIAVGAVAIVASGAAIAVSQADVEVVSAPTDAGPPSPIMGPMTGSAMAPSEVTAVATPTTIPPAVQAGALPASKGGEGQAPAVVPMGGAERLANLDKLRADIEEARLRAELAKLNAQEREAGSPTNNSGSGAINPAGSGSGSLPPLPIFPAASAAMPASLEMPPMPPRMGSVPNRAAASAPATSSGVEFMEAWGAGRDIQARILTPSGDRIVRVGDKVLGGKVASITGSALTIEDARGKTRTFN